MKMNERRFDCIFGVSDFLRDNFLASLEASLRQEAIVLERASFAFYLRMLEDGDLRRRLKGVKGMAWIKSRDSLILLGRRLHDKQRLSRMRFKVQFHSRDNIAKKIFQKAA